MAGYWIGIDTGGTFTDLVLAEPAAGRWHYHKVPTRTADPAAGIHDGIGELLALSSVAAAEVEFLVLGTTLATNAVLEGKWAKTGLVTTEGFRDVIELARQRRPDYFNLDKVKPLPPAARDCRMEAIERVDVQGRVVVPLDESSVHAAVAALKAAGVSSVAICFLHSYQNPAHELRTRQIIEQSWPEVTVCASHEVLAEFREFERCASTLVNASLMPIMASYLDRFEAGVRSLGVPRTPRVMQSNGGAVTPAAVKRLPINTFFSGPAGGVIGSVRLGSRIGLPDLITFDMGGTSTDVCLIKAGEPAKKSQREMGGYPVRTRTLDIHTIGAGGGSIAWIDAGGLLKVGPRSAGAFPGPAAYGRGGTEPTVTDANVVLGRLSPESLLGGRMKMHPERARETIDALAGKLGVSAVQACAGVIEIVNVNMMGALRVISIEQGEDPRDFVLVAFGGAGPLHAVEVAAAMGMRHVLVPARPGLLSAEGLLQADQRGDFSLTRLVTLAAPQLPSIDAGFAELRRRGELWLAEEQARSDSAAQEWSADLRYVGQSFELVLPLAQGWLDEALLAVLIEAFHARHKAYYGYDIRDQAVELVNLRFALTVPRPRPAFAAPAPAVVASAVKREVWFAATGYVATPVFERAQLATGQRFDGPAIIEQMDATTVVPPDAHCRIDDAGNIHIKLGT